MAEVWNTERLRKVAMSTEVYVDKSLHSPFTWHADIIMGDIRYFVSAVMGHFLFMPERTLLVLLFLVFFVVFFVCFFFFLAFPSYISGVHHFG